MADKNISDLSIEKRQAIADRAKEAGMTAEEVAAQLAKAGIGTSPVAQKEVVQQAAPIQDPIDTQTGEPVSVQKTVETPEVSAQVTKEVTPTGPAVTQEVKADTPIDTQTGAPAGEKPVTQPTTPPDTPTTPETPTGLPGSIQDWKAQGSNIADLERMIETQNNTTITNENGVLKGVIDGVEYQWQIDQAGNPIKTKVGGEDTNAIYQQLQAGQEIADTGIKTTKAYSKAKARSDVTNKYIGMTEDQLYSAYVNGEINQTLEQDIASNPNLAVAKEKYNKKLVTDNINAESTTMLNAFGRADGTYTPKEEKSYLEKLSDTILASYANQGKDAVGYKQYMAENYPDLVTDTKELNQKSLELKQLADIRDGRVDDIIKSHPGITITRANMLAARENKDINEQIKSMSYEIGNLQANINYQTTLADKEFGYEQQNEQQRAILEAEKRGQAFSLLQTAQAQNFQQQQIADQRAYEQANQGVSTSMIQVGNKQQLINSETGELIKEYDLATGQAITEKPINIGTTAKPNWVTYNQTTGQYDPISISGTRDTPTYTGTAADFIKESEGFVDYVYDDATGQALSPGMTSTGTPTIGYGFTTVAGQPVIAGMEILDNGNIIKNGKVISNVDTELQNQIARHSNYANLVTTDLSEQQKAALASFEYNLGPNIWSGTGKTIIDKINKGDFAGAGEDMKQYVNANGEFMQGLADRRQKEADLLMQGGEQAEPLSDKQFTQSNQIINSFKGDAQVKAFEEAYSQGLNLISSLADKTGPGDVAGIFQFMKTLDPQSVVRESEFEVAANSAGVINKLGNTFDRLKEGKVLTNTQAEAFGALAKQFIINKATLYDAKYNDGIRRLEKQGIDTSVFPSSTANEMRKLLDTSTSVSQIEEDNKGSIKDLVNKYTKSTEVLQTGGGATDIDSLYNKYY